jgi:hypothetical protein
MTIVGSTELRAAIDAVAAALAAQEAREQARLQAESERLQRIQELRAARADSLLMSAKYVFDWCTAFKDTEDWCRIQQLANREGQAGAGLESRALPVFGARFFRGEPSPGDARTWGTLSMRWAGASEQCQAHLSGPDPWKFVVQDLVRWAS